MLPLLSYKIIGLANSVLITHPILVRNNNSIIKLKINKILNLISNYFLVIIITMSSYEECQDLSF